MQNGYFINYPFSNIIVKMNILIACHKPPGYNHPNVYKLNTNIYKANKTRKNTLRSVSSNGNQISYLNLPGKVSYIDKYGKKIPDLRPANDSPNWFPTWEHIPDNSINIVWAQECPIKHPFWAEELNQHFDYEESSDAYFLEGEGSLDDVWRNLFQHGKRILKNGGKIIVPIPIDDEMMITNSTHIKLIARIINMEALPDYLFKIRLVEPLSKTHSSYLRDLFILKETQLNPVLAHEYMFLVLEKHSITAAFGGGSATRRTRR